MGLIAMGIKDRIAIVTGGANGIGLATASHFAEQGARVAIWDLAEEAGVQHASTLNAAGYTAVFQKVNVTDPDSIGEGVKATLAEWGRIDILINNAGIVRDGQLVKYKDGAVQKVMSDDMFDQVVNVNLKGVFACTRAVVPHMIEQQHGRILSTSSVVGLYGNFGQTNYVATKSGVIGMTKVWARELGKFGITANAVAPGFIETDILKSMPQKVLDRMVNATPVGRMGQPEDIANAFAFLASDEASFVNGTVLSVDGGMVLGT
jgi:3-oxoacyl-[acyl-carrier protein] reductase